MLGTPIGGGGRAKKVLLTVAVPVAAGDANLVVGAPFAVNRPLVDALRIDVRGAHRHGAHDAAPVAVALVPLIVVNTGVREDGGISFSKPTETESKLLQG